MFCRYCGAKIPDDSRFCPECGRVLEQPETATGHQEAPQPPDAPKAAPKWTVPQLPKLPKSFKEPGGKGKFPTPVIIAVAAVAVVVAVLALGGNRDKPNPKSGYSPSVSSRSTPSPTAKPSEPSTATASPTPEPTQESIYQVSTITYEDGRVYVGQTLAGVPWGEGKITYAEGDSSNRLYYEGEWSNGVKKGRGTMVWTTGAMYTGQWDNDYRNGPGVYTSDKGNVYTGTYVNGKRDGAFTLVTSDGKVYALTYDKGGEVSRTEITDPKTVAAAIAGEPITPPTDKATPTTAPKATDTPSPTATPKNDASSQVADGQLPDPGAFFQCGRNEDQANTSYGSDGRLVSYKFDLDDGQAGVSEFIKLLQEDCYHLALRDTAVNDYTKTSGSKFENYYFDYTGQKTVGVIHDGSKGPTANVHVLVGYYYGEGRIGLAFSYGSGLTLTDAGDRASTLPEDFVGTSSSGSSSGGSSGSSSGSSSGTTKVKVKCYKCKGEGKITCTECDGKGYKVSYVSSPNYSGHSSTSKEVRTKCSKCKGLGTIECPKCHGSGEG